MAHWFDRLTRRVAEDRLTRRTLIGGGVAALVTVTSGSICDKSPTDEDEGGCGAGCKSGYACCFDAGLCCPGNTPHYCANTNRCYQYFTDAQKACGNSYEVCGNFV